MPHHPGSKPRLYKIAAEAFRDESDDRDWILSRLAMVRQGYDVPLPPLSSALLPTHVVQYACVRVAPSVPVRCSNRYCGEWIFGDACERCGKIP